jgi:hypothetical protein
VTYAFILVVLIGSGKKSILPGKAIPESEGLAFKMGSGDGRKIFRLDGGDSAKGKGPDNIRAASA